MKNKPIIALIILAGAAFLGGTFVYQNHGAHPSGHDTQRYRIPSNGADQESPSTLVLPDHGSTDDIKKHIRAISKKRYKKPSPVKPEVLIESRNKHRENAVMFLWARRAMNEIGDDKAENFVYALCKYEIILEKEFAKFAISVSHHYKRKFALNLMNTARNYEQLCKYSMADVYYQRALELSRETGEQIIEASILTNMGVLNARKGMYRQALDLFKQSLDIDTRTNNSEGILCNHINLSNVAANMGDNTLSSVYLASAKNELDGQHIENTETYRAIISNNEALSLFFKKDVKKALNLIDKLSQHLNEKKKYQKNVIAFNKAELLSTMGRYDEANGIYSDLIEYFKYKTTLNSHCSSFKYRLAETRDDTEIRSLPDNFYRYDSELYWRTQRGLAIGLLHKQSNPNEIAKHNQAVLLAIDHIRSSMDTMEERAEFMSDKSWVADEMINVYVSLHMAYPNKGFDKLAWDVFERKQGREFLDRVGKSGARNFSRKPQNLIEYENNYKTYFKKRISIIGDENKIPRMIIQGYLETVSFEALKHKTHMARNFPEYTGFINPTPVSCKETQEGLLQPDEAIVVFQTTSVAILTWVISKDRFYLHTTAYSQDDLTRTVNEFRKHSSQDIIDEIQAYADAETLSNRINKSFADFIPVSSGLYHLLFPEEVNQALTGKTTLFIVPTGCLHDLPFEALISGALPDNMPRYLLHDYAVSYLSSASMLKLIYDTKQKRESEHRPEQKGLLAFANPEFASNGLYASTRGQAYMALMGGEFAELPETEEEVRTISLSLKATNPQGVYDLFLRDKANKENILNLNTQGVLDTYKYIVFATHAIIPGDIDDVLQPAIVLSDAGGESFLTLNDILGLKINADMVVLSACNTGRGRMIRGEGTYSLSRAFMYSGASTATMNLWSVESMSAKQISTGLFTYLSASQTPVKALQSSKKDFLDKAASGGNTLQMHPFFWAPTILYGNLSQAHLNNEVLTHESYKKPAYKTKAELIKVIWDGNRFITVGEIDTLFTSPDGITWYDETPGMGSDHNLHTIVFANNTYFLTETRRLGGKELAYASTNLFQWDFLLDDYQRRLPAWGNGWYVFVSAKGKVWRSTDLKSWAVTEIPNCKGDIYDLTFGGPPGEERFICAGSEIYTSPDGESWHTAFAPREEDRFSRIVWNGEQFLIVGKHYFLTSPKGEVWIPWKIEMKKKPVAWNGEVYVMAMGKQTATSPDGIYWDIRDRTDEKTHGRINDITCSESTCVAVGNSGLIIYSNDNVAWKKARLKRKQYKPIQ